MSVILEQSRSPHVKKWTKEEYLDLVERGVFRGQRVFLFRGDIIEIAPQGHPHAYAIMKLARYLNNTYPEPFEIRMQLPFVTPGTTVPEPDAAVCSAEDAARKPHPAHAELAIEVAYSSIDVDRELAEDYAAAGVPEYWIVDVDRRLIEVYRTPHPDPTAGFGHRYQQTLTRKNGEGTSPANRPDAEIPVGGCLLQVSIRLPF